MRCDISVTFGAKTGYELWYCISMSTWCGSSSLYSEYYRRYRLGENPDPPAPLLRNALVINHIIIIITIAKSDAILRKSSISYVMLSV